MLIFLEVVKNKPHKQINKNYSIDLKTPKKVVYFKEETQGGHPHIFGPPHLCTNAAAEGW